MARDNPTWGQKRIANELLLKLGLRVSLRTVRKYMPKRLDHGRGQRVSFQHWRTFVRNHAQAIVAYDFCVVVTATFRLLYVFVIMEHEMRRGASCTATSPRIPLPNGPYSNCARQSRLTTPIAFCCTTRIASSPSSLIKAYGAWACGS
jgi:hypothetical protein